LNEVQMTDSNETALGYGYDAVQLRIPVREATEA
jgi:hypothetical protein